MTITTEVLIAAARAIGVDVTETPNGQLFINDDSSPYAFWNPLHDKAQLMDLYYELQLDVNFHKDGGGYINDLRLADFIQFDGTFESFATAIILAAAEIGRGMK